MKFTDEQLSRILSAHEAGALQARGRDWWTKCEMKKGCINQYAFNIPYMNPAYDRKPGVARWFDRKYCSNWSSSELLRHLEDEGFA